MDISKARILLGETGKKMTDQQVEKLTDDMNTLVNILLDHWEKMTPEERNKFKKKSK